MNSLFEPRHCLEFCRGWVCRRRGTARWRVPWWGRWSRSSRCSSVGTTATGTCRCTPPGSWGTASPASSPYSEQWSNWDSENGLHFIESCDYGFPKVSLSKCVQCTRCRWPRPRCLGWRAPPAGSWSWTASLAACREEETFTTSMICTNYEKSPLPFWERVKNIGRIIK